MIEQSPPRAVLDTNVIIAALKSNNADSPTRELLRRWIAGEFVLILSESLYVEYLEKLEAKRISENRKELFLTRIEYLAQFVDLQDDHVEVIVADDSDDDIVIGTALAGEATHLVTYDPHLLNLGSPFRGIEILDGFHFLYVVRGDTPPE